MIGHRPLRPLGKRVLFRLPKFPCSVHIATQPGIPARHPSTNSPASHSFLQVAVHEQLLVLFVGLRHLRELVGTAGDDLRGRQLAVGGAGEDCAPWTIQRRQRFSWWCALCRCPARRAWQSSGARTCSPGLQRQMRQLLARGRPTRRNRVNRDRERRNSPIGPGQPKARSTPRRRAIAGCSRGRRGWSAAPPTRKRTACWLSGHKGLLEGLITIGRTPIALGAVQDDTRRRPSSETVV